MLSLKKDVDALKEKLNFDVMNLLEEKAGFSRELERT